MSGKTLFSRALTPFLASLFVVTLSASASAQSQIVLNGNDKPGETTLGFDYFTTPAGHSLFPTQDVELPTGFFGTRTINGVEYASDKIKLKNVEFEGDPQGIVQTDKIICWRLEGLGCHTGKVGQHCVATPVYGVSQWDTIVRRLDKIVIDRNNSATWSQSTRIQIQSLNLVSSAGVKVTWNKADPLNTVEEKFILRVHTDPTCTQPIGRATFTYDPTTHQLNMKMDSQDTSHGLPLCFQVDFYPAAGGSPVNFIRSEDAFSADYNGNAVPEPGSIVLFGGGALGILVASRRRLRRAK